MVLDNADLWNPSCEGLALDAVIETLVEQTCRLQVVCTSTSTVLSSSVVASSVYQLGGLCSIDALRLCVLSCPRTTTDLERQVMFHLLSSSRDLEYGSLASFSRGLDEILNAGVPSQIIAEAGRYLETLTQSSSTLMNS